jgi:hypothetical protein
MSDMVMIGQWTRSGEGNVRENLCGLELVIEEGDHETRDLPWALFCNFCLLLRLPAACNLTKTHAPSSTHDQYHPSHLQHHSAMATEGTNHHMDDAMDASDTRSGTPDTEIIVGDQGSENLLFGNNLRSRLNAGGDRDGENNGPRNELRSKLDDDEKFLESPELYQQVVDVAKRYKLSDRLVHEDYRGQDRLTHYKSMSGTSTIDVPSRMDFRPTVAIGRLEAGSGGGNGQNVWGLDHQHEHTDWLHISFLPDSQMPQIILRIRHATTEDAEETFVHIFATNLTRCSYDAIKFETGEDVSFKLSPKEVQRERPWLAESVEEGMVTAMHIKLCRFSKGETDGEGRRLSKVVFSGKGNAQDLKRMEDKPATPQEKLIGLIRADKIRELSFYTEYDSGNQAAETPREQAFCEYFRSTMVLCNQLGHFWAYRCQFPAISWKDAASRSPSSCHLRGPSRNGSRDRRRQVLGRQPRQREQLSGSPSTGRESSLEVRRRRFVAGLDAVEEDGEMRTFVRKDSTKLPFL